MLDETFEYPADFSPSDYLDSAFRVMTGEPQRVLLQFLPRVAHLIKEKIWHPSQDITQSPDGSILLHLETAINYEIISWVLGFGSACRVLEPLSLKKQIRKELEESLNQYNDVGKKKLKLIM